MRIVVIADVAEDGLDRTVWGFWFSTDREVLILDTYEIQVRRSKRHAWKTPGASYARTVGRSSIREADVPLPDYVKRRALEELAERITVRKWEGGR